MLSNILLENNSEKNINSMKSFVELEDTSILYTMLEFNDDMHHIDTECKIAYFKALMAEATGNEEYKTYSEGFLSNVKEKILNGFDAFIKFINNIVKAIIEKFKELGRIISNKFKKSKIDDATKEDRNNGINDKYFTSYTFRVPSYIDIGKFDQIYSISEQSAKKAFEKVQELLSQRNLSGLSEDNIGFFKDLEENTVTTMKQTLGMPNDIDNIEDGYKSLFSFKDERMTFNEYINIWNKYSAIIEPGTKNFKKWGDNFTNILTTVKVMQRVNGDIIETDAEYIKIINASLDFFQKISNFVFGLNNAHLSHYQKGFNYTSKIVDMFIAAEDENIDIDGININESSTMHGEIFDSETLFSNEDLRDFNRNEWDDLSDIITTESFNLNFEYDEYRKRTTLLECMILAEGGENAEHDLQVMRESEKDSFIERIKEFFRRIWDFLKSLVVKTKEELNPIVQFVKSDKDKIKDCGKDISSDKCYETKCDIDIGLKNIVSLTDNIGNFNVPIIDSDMSDNDIRQHINDYIDKNLERFKKSNFDKSENKLNKNVSCSAYANVATRLYCGSTADGSNCHYNVSEPYIRDNIDFIINSILKYNIITSALNKAIEKTDAYMNEEIKAFKDENNTLNKTSIHTFYRELSTALFNIYRTCDKYYIAIATDMDRIFKERLNMA